MSARAAAVWLSMVVGVVVGVAFPPVIVAPFATVPSLCTSTSRTNAAFVRNTSRTRRLKTGAPPSASSGGVSGSGLRIPWKSASGLGSGAPYWEMVPLRESTACLMAMITCARFVVVTVVDGVATPPLTVAVSMITPSFGAECMRSRSMNVARMTASERSCTVASPSATPSSAGNGSPSKTHWNPMRCPTPTLRGSDVPKNIALPSSIAARSIERLVASVSDTEARAG